MKITLETIQEWRARNNNGEGFPLGEQKDTPREVAERMGLEIIDEVTESHYPFYDYIGSILAKQGNDIILVCNLNGPWACVVSQGE